MTFSILSMAHRSEYDALAKAVRHLRRERELSQEALGAAAGLSGRHVSVIERGERDVRLATLLRLAEALDVSAGELFKSIDQQKQLTQDQEANATARPPDRRERRPAALPSHRYRRMKDDWPSGSARSTRTRR